MCSLYFHWRSFWFTQHHKDNITVKIGIEFSAISKGFWALHCRLQGLLANWVIWHTPFQLFAPSFPPHLEKPWGVFKMWGKAWRVSDFTVSNRLRNHLKPLNKCPGNVLEWNELVMVKTTYLISFPVHRPLSSLLNGQHCSTPQLGLTHWQKYTETKM